MLPKANRRKKEIQTLQQTKRQTTHNKMNTKKEINIEFFSFFN